MPTHVCTVDEAMTAYQEFCRIVPRYTDASNTDINLFVHDELAAMASDIDKANAWITTYRETHTNRWWECKPAKEIIDMMLQASQGNTNLPLTKVDLVEVAQLVITLQG
jgi:hypothetical protein